MKEYKKTLLLVPSAYNSKVMGDISNFIKFYKDKFDLYVIYDKENKIDNGVTFLNKKDKKAVYLKYTADYIIDAGSINGNTRVSVSQKRVSVWHGIPYKKMFIDLGKEYVEEALEYGYGCDLMISPSKFYTEEFLRKSMLYNGDILETAVSRTDHLYKSDDEKNNLKDILGIPKNKKVLLYAPTFRKKGIFKLPFDVNRMREILNKNDEEWVIVTKLHYLNELEDSSNVIDCTNYSDVNDILTISDMLITDYSSLMFDFSILKKPCIFYQYDKDSYKLGRGFMFDLEDYVDKKYIVSNESDLLKIVHKVKNVDNMEHIRKTFYPHQKENSTKDLVQKLNFDSTPRKTKDIIFLVNELNQIGGVHNFILNLSKEFKSKCNSKIFVFATSLLAAGNDDFYEFDKDNIIDIKLSAKDDLEKIVDILNGTDGYIISCQFGAHKYFEKYLNNKNNILMFHGDVKDVINKTLYKWHLNGLNNYSIYNYKKLLLLTKGNMNLLNSSINPKLKDRLGFIENSFNFNRKDYYSYNGEFALISRLDDDKNVFDALKIFSNKKLNKNFKLHVYGDGKLRNEFESQIKKLNLENKIIIHGYCNNKDEMYKNKQGIILTSLSEGFPLSVLEAVNYGIPVYLYNSFTAAKEFEKFSNIHLVKSSDCDEFVSILNKKCKIIKNEFDEISMLFSNDTILNKWLKLFDEIEELENVQPSTKRNIKDKVIILKPKFINFIYKVARKVFEKNTKLRADLLLTYNCLTYKVRNIAKKKKYPLVSLIVPYYNNYDVIENLLKSIRDSGYSNYEVILVNDGSKQDPSDIIKKYKNIKYFYKENTGLGETRNYAIDRATGKYVFFIDSDDTLCKYALNYLVDYAEKYKLDLVGGRCRKIPFGSKICTYWNRKIFSKTYINTMDKRHLLLRDTISTVKLYNLETLKKSNIRFETGLYEDKLYISQIYQYFDKIGIVNKDIYNWYSYGIGTSITTSYTFKNIKERVDKMERIYDLSFNRFKMYYVSNAISHDLMVFVNNFISFSEKDRKKVYDLFRKYFEDKKKYIYMYNIEILIRKEIIQALLSNNYERFCNISNCISYNYMKKRNLLSE